MIFEMIFRFRKEWKKYVPVVLMYLYIIITTNRYFEKNGLQVLFTDYLYRMFMGTKITHTKSINNRIVQVSDMYVLFNFYMLWTNQYYAFKDTLGVETQVLLKKGSTVKWWCTKCVWSIFNTISFYVLGYGMFEIAYIFEKISKWNKTEFYLLSEYKLHRNKILLIGFCTLVIVSIGLHIFQMMLSLLIGKIYAAIITIAILIISIYYASPLCVGNYLMMLRYTDWEGYSGVDPIVGIIIGVVVTIIGMIVGSLKVKRVDFI